MDPILDGLNEKQREAVLQTEGALLVLAGAGSGKTRVITHRFAYLLQNRPVGINNILAVTFTNKAAGEMKERIAHLTGLDPKTAWIRTFHSMGVQLLRRHPEAIGYPRDFVIYDDTDSKGITRTLMKDMGVNPETYPPAGVADKIASLKDSLTSPGEFEKSVHSAFDEVALKVYVEYEKTLKKNRAVDFADLIGLPIKIFSENEQIRSHYRQLWRYIMVDEFQDTNKAQYQLIQLIAGEKPNLCVVGDDDQSIYGWRGAVVDNIYDFQNRFQAKVVPLEQNYRSTEVILTAANSVVAKIPNRMEKKLWTSKTGGEPIYLVSTNTDRDEAASIAEEIDSLLAKYDCRDMAIFYRTNAQSRLLEEALLAKNIPYKIFGGQKFFDRKEIKDILAYIKLIVNPYDGASFERIVNVPKRKIGEATQDKIRAAAGGAGISYVEVLLNPEMVAGLKPGALPILKDLGQILYELNQSMESITPTHFVKVLIDAVHFRDYIMAFDEDGADRWSNVEELINSIKEFENANPDARVSEFLEMVTLQASVDTLEEDTDRNTVSLMTIHNAKGLEFPVVFCTGVVDGLIPLGSASASEKELYEERRLFYVAITRAREKLYLSYPDTRLKYGELIYCRPSPFLDDVPENLLNRVTVKRSFAAGPSMSGFKDRSNWGEKKNPAKSYSSKTSGGNGWKKVASGSKTAQQPPRKAEKPAPMKGKPLSSIEELSVGQTILHRQFGPGKVSFISSHFIKVQFEDYGTQTLSGNFIQSLSAVDS